MDLTDLKLCLNNCYAPQYTKITDLVPMVPYKIVKFARAPTRFGETIRATVMEGITGDDLLLNVYLPQRYLAILSDATIETYNKGEGKRMALMFRGLGKGIEFV